MAESLVGSAVKLLGSAAWREVDQLKRFHPDFDDMEKKFVQISAVLRIAEDRSSIYAEQKVTEAWLEKLRAVAYDVQDVLGDYQAHAAKFEESTALGKAKQILSSSNPLWMKHTTAQTIQKLKQNLDDVARDPLVKKFEQIAAPAEIHMKYERFIPENANDIVGRDADKLKITQLLQEAGKSTTARENGVPILPIVGLGGVGKSTIAKIIFDEAQDFHQKIWVTVTRHFSWRRIAKSILEEGGKNVDLPQEDDQLINLIKEKLQNKKCFLVLDDVWNDKTKPGVPQELKQMLQDYTGQGSQAIVTTRNAKVACLMRNITPQYNLEILSDDDCWVLFSRRAFLLYPENRSTKEEVGKEIVRKCGGLPLGALSLGSIMSHKKESSEWEAVRDSELWSVEDNYPGHEDRVAPSIKLSYYHMPPEWRRCFQYCAIFPKGFEVEKKKLVEQWVALDMVEEAKAEGYLNGLMAIYFLQISDKSHGIDEPSHVLKRRDETEVLHMHDMVHEVARSVGHDFILVVNASEEKAMANPSYHTCRYAQLSNYREGKLTSECLPPKSRALHLPNCHIDKVPLKAAKYLRVLDFSGCSSEGFPTSVSDLKYLRYLDASSNPLKELTKECTELRNLLFFDLSKTSLEVLPSNFPKLRNLVSLNLSCCRHLKELPDGLGENDNIKFFDLSHCTKIHFLPESICKLTKLESLNLSECERLQRLPESFGDLTSLEHLDLSGCSDLEQLPESFGRLHGLILLDLSNCSQLQGFPETSNDGYKKLQHLYLSGCSILKKLPISFGTSPLETLDLVDCYNLEDGPDNFPCTLMGLDISDCHSMEIHARSFAHMKKMKILRLKGCQFNHSVVESLGCLTELEYLDLSATRMHKIPESFGNLKKLQTLYLFGDQLFAIYKDKCLSEETISKMISLKTVWVLDKVLASKVPADKVRDSVLDIAKEITKKYVKLTISDLSARSNGEEIAKREKIKERSDVDNLTLEWSSDYESRASDDGNEAVLQMLQPHPNLGSYQLENYPGYGFPRWVLESRSLLPKLKIIGLTELRNCASLPPFGELPNLTGLFINSMPMLRKVTMDICGQSERPFRKLGVLSLVKMENLEEWQTSDNTNGVDRYMFPVIWDLKVESCPKLRFMPSIPKCLEYGIVDSGMTLEAVEGSSQFPSYAELPGPLTCSSPFRLLMEGGRMSSKGWNLLQSFHTLTELELFPSMSSELPQSIRSLVNLKRLYLSNCNNLPDWLGDLVKLEMLTIEHCYFVRPLHQSLQRLTALETLVITSCRGQLSESIPSVPSLRFLVIRLCRDFNTLPKCLGQARSLELLNIIDCPNLKSISYGLMHLKNSGVLKISISNPTEEILNLRKTGWMNQAYTPLAAHYMEEGQEWRLR